LQSLEESQPFDAHYEIENGSASSATKAMKKAALGVDRKRWSLLVMEGAQADEVAAGALEPHLRADDLDDIGAVSHFLDFILAESGHRA
jgi:hypothetical protein